MSELIGVTKMKIVVIKDINRNIMYKVEVPNKTSENREIRVAIEKLIKQGKSLDYADLSYTDLEGTSFFGASLYRADLRNTNLTDSYLYHSCLQLAMLEGAIINIKENLLLKNNGYFVVTINESLYYTVNALECFNTNKGLYIKSNNFFGDEDEFKVLINKSKSEDYIKVCLLAIELAQANFNLT